MTLAVDPNITDWMQGWGSIIGAVTSSVAVIFTGLLLRHEMRMRREERADRDAAQARLVVGELTPTTEPAIAGENGEERKYRWEVHNFSEAPVLDVSVGIAERSKLPTTWFIFREVSILGDHAAGECPVFNENYVLSQYEFYVEYTDAKGLRWYRLGKRSPKRLFMPARYSIFDKLRRRIPKRR